MPEKSKLERTIKAGVKQDNTILIGKKPAKLYVFACMTQFMKGTKNVYVKARGGNITHAVDVAEVMRRSDPSVRVDRIGIATEEFKNAEQKQVRVSSIEIMLTKG